MPVLADVLDPSVHDDLGVLLPLARPTEALHEQLPRESTAAFASGMLTFERFLHAGQFSHASFSSASTESISALICPRVRCDDNPSASDARGSSAPDPRPLPAAGLRLHFPTKAPGSPELESNVCSHRIQAFGWQRYPDGDRKGRDIRAVAYVPTPYRRRGVAPSGQRSRSCGDVAEVRVVAVRGRGAPIVGRQRQAAARTEAQLSARGEPPPARARARRCWRPRLASSSSSMAAREMPTRSASSAVVTNPPVLVRAGTRPAWSPRASAPGYPDRRNSRLERPGRGELEPAFELADRDELAPATPHPPELRRDVLVEVV